MQSKLAQLFLISLITLLFSQCVHAIYSKKYDVSLLTLVLTNPKEALAKSKEQLIQAEIAGDVEKQLIALFYSAHSLDVLTQFDEVDYIIEKGLALANKNGNIRFISEFTGYKAYQQEIKGDFRAAIINANKAHLYAIETGDDRLIGESLALRGGVQLAIENYDMAMKDIEGAIEIFKAYDDRMNLSIHYNSLAILYSDLGDSENALKYYKESVEYDELKAPYDQATILYNIGAEYAIKKDYKQAMEYYMKAMALSKLLGDKYILAFIHYGMAELMLLQNNLNEAEETLATVFNGFESAQDVMMLLNSYLLMAEIHTVNKKYSLAFEQLELAREKCEILDTPSVYLSYYQQLITYYVAQDMWKEAYEHKTKLATIKSNVNTKNKENLTSELKIKFNAQFDHEKLELLQKQNSLQKNVIKQEQTKQNYLWMLLLLGLTLFIITFTAYLNQAKSKKRLYKLSTTDDLTNVANRRHIMKKLKKLHQLNLTENTPFLLVMIDLDYFKKINDTFGHEIGNEVLKHFAQSAKNVLQMNGDIGRIGGEEWLLLLPETDINQVRNVLQELREAYKNYCLLKIPEDCVLSFSSGVLKCNGQYDSYEKMLTGVDAAMYQAKEKGREQDVYI